MDKTEKALKFIESFSGWFNVNDLKQMSGLSASTCSSLLLGLQDSGYLVARRVTKAKHMSGGFMYQYNRSSVIELDNYWRKFCFSRHSQVENRRDI